ncbi:MAG: hypothetical protein ACLTQI_06690 [Slackia sp.]
MVDLATLGQSGCRYELLVPCGKRSRSLRRQWTYNFYDEDGSTLLSSSTWNSDAQIGAWVPSSREGRL